MNMRKINWTLIRTLPADAAIVTGGPEYGCFRCAHVPADRHHVEMLLAETGEGLVRRLLEPRKGQPSKYTHAHLIAGRLADFAYVYARINQEATDEWRRLGRKLYTGIEEIASPVRVAEVSRGVQVNHYTFQRKKTWYLVRHQYEIAESVVGVPVGTRPTSRVIAGPFDSKGDANFARKLREDAGQHPEPRSYYRQTS